MSTKLPESVHGMVDISVAGAREHGHWEVPSTGLPKDFADAFRDLYMLSVSSATIRQRTAEWIAIMRETKDAKG